MVSRKILIALVVAIILVIPVVVVIAVFTGGNGGDDDVSPLVNTTVGMIRGKRSDDDGYSMYLGIPYATVNKSNPFGASEPNPVFTEVFNAYDDTAMCPQIEEFNNTLSGSLDCLHLNVYVPDSARPENKLPVLVWIYGGAYSIGFAGRFLYGPKFLIRHDIILVTLNYRLGPYGFMCLNTPEVPGNEGLKDQLKALRWIKNNINAFNGDVEKITIFGESAGGVSVDFQLLFAEDGLFHRMITQSGTTFCPWAVGEPDLAAPFKLAEALGFRTDVLREATTFLASQITNDVIKAGNDLGLSFNPCVEKRFNNVEIFVHEHPLHLDVAKAKSVPIIAGYNDDEMLAPHSNRPADYFTNLTMFSPHLNRSFDFGALHDSKVPFVSRFYVGDEPLSKDHREAIIDFHSDITFVHPVHRSVKKYLDNNANVFYYVFSYTGGRNFGKLRANITDGGAAHADEIGYLFDISYMTDTPSADDQLIIDRITTMWTNFVKYGNPTPQTSDLLPINWIPVTEQRKNYLDITKNMTLGARPFHRRLTYWDLFFKSNEEFIRGYKRK